MLPDIDKIFYFDSHFAPIIDIKLHDTPEKRFGHVLSIMRQARGMTSQEQLEIAIDSTSKRGNSRISNWETGKIRPSGDELELIFKALTLNDSDRNYLLGLLFNSSESIELSQIEIDNIQKEFESLRDSPYPAYWVDHYWTIHDTNDATQRLLLINQRMAKKIIGKENILSIIFNPIYGVMRTIGSEGDWLSLAQSQIWRYRAISSGFRHHKKFMSDVYHLLDHHKFLWLWYEKPIIDTDPSTMATINLEPSEKPLNFHLNRKDRTMSGGKFASIIEWGIGDSSK